MCVFFESFDEREVILEIPNFYRRVVTRTDYIRLSRVDYYASQKVWMPVELFDFFHGIVVIQL